MLNDITQQEHWIVEGAHYKWGQESFSNAELIVMLTPNSLLRDCRVIGRFIKTRLGIEQWNYKQSLKNLREMLFVYNRGFDREGMQHVLAMTDQFAEKRIIINNTQGIVEQIEARLADIKEPGE